jgi:serine phosphatase RsbU (regulator of sigma subunit)
MIYAKKAMKCIPLIISLFCLHFILGAQNPKIDSLLILLKTDKLDTNKVNHLNKLSREYINHSEYDEGLKYANEALALSKNIFFQNKKGWAKGESFAYNNVGTIYFYLGDYSNALKNQLAGLTVNEKAEDKKGIATSYNNIGAIYWKQGDYPNALKNYLASLEVAQKIQDNANIARAYNNIGLIYQIQKKYPEALKNYFDALAIKKEINDKKGIAMSYNNIGNVYSEQQNYPEALKNHEIALKLREELGDKQDIVMSHINIGLNYYNEKNYSEALSNYKAALEIAEKIHDKYGVATSLLNLGQAQIELNQLKEAKISLNKSLQLSIEIGDKDGIMKNYLSLSGLDSIRGNCESSLMNYKLFTKYKNIIDNEETKKKMVENSMTHEFKQREMATKAEQDKKDAIAEAEKQRQQTILYFISTGLFLVLLLTIFIFRGYKQKQKANVIITQQKAEVEKQKELVEEKNKEITDSINYAERIQRALFASKRRLDNNLKNYFILFKPKEKVSGDFYSAIKLKNNHFLLVTADSTGHGVPGAIMSILNIACLRTAITQGFTQPDLLLNETRRLIIKTLKDDGSEEGGKDGMDGSVLCFDFENKILYCATANNPIWIIRNNELIEIKADRMPIGKHDKDSIPFTLHTIHLQESDTIYTLTDGYADQFGGPKGKKFKQKQLQEILLNIYNEPMETQKQKLDEVFVEWKGNLEQVDDVCLIGIRI